MSVKTLSNFFKLFKALPVWILLVSMASLTFFSPIRAQTGDEVKKTFYFKKQPIHLTIADTSNKREKGLMFRKNRLGNSGMLFVFDKSDNYCFWMKNTFIPLSIAFLDKNQTITEIVDMSPHNLSPICSHTPVLFALEVDQGWFVRQKIKQGDQLTPSVLLVSTAQKSAQKS